MRGVGTNIFTRYPCTIPLLINTISCITKVFIKIRFLYIESLRKIILSQ